MPRNAQGVYTLPAGNPVVAGTLIETTWANPTMSDIAAALTGSLPRDGSAPMTADLILANNHPSTPLSAASKAYVESFMVYATGLPVSAITAFAGNTPPPGFLECNGQAVSRTTYSELWGSIGTIYGSGDGVSTFNVPDLRDQFIRGKSAARAVGSLQAGSFAAHTHPVQDPGHTHQSTAIQAAHSHGVTTVAHSHGVNDPGHSHSMSVGAFQSGNEHNSGSGNLPINPTATGASGTGISIAAAAPTGTADSQTPAITLTNASSTTGETIGASGGTETVPQNMALIYIIKALNDSPPITGVTAIDTSDTNMISINSANPTIPELVIHSNIAFGIPKLDANAKVSLAQLPQGAVQLLGYFDASGGANPSQEFPATDYSNGQSYIISVGGTILVRNPATSVESNVLVAVGGTLLYLEGQTQPDGWYYSVPVAADSAANISFLPEGTISAVNVQAAIAELDSETQASLALKQNNLPSQTGQAGQFLTTNGSALDWAEVDALPLQTGHSGEFLTTDGTDPSWVAVQANSTSFGLFEHAANIAANYTIGTGNNAISGGPVTVDNGVSVTVPSGSVWSIV
jgi:microcystin-dependent protein